MGFIKVIGNSNEAMTYSLYDFASEGIEGWYWIYGYGGAALNVNAFNPQPVFWNRMSGTTREFNLLASHKNSVVNFKSVGGNWILNNTGGGGTSKIQVGGQTSQSSRVSITDGFFYFDSMDTLLVDPFFGEFLLEIDGVSSPAVQPYCSVKIRQYISSVTDFWQKYLAAVPSAAEMINLGVLIGNDKYELQSFSTGSKWTDIGQIGRTGTYGIAAESKWYRVASTTLGRIAIANALKSNVLITGIGVQNAHPQFVSDTNPDFANIYAFASMYVGDDFDYKRWGVVGMANGATNDKPTVPVLYDQDEDLVFTGVYKITTLATLASNGEITFASNILGPNAGSIASLIGRKIWITSGPNEGLQGTITARVDADTLDTDILGYTISSGFTCEVEANFNPSPGPTVMSVLVSFYTEQGNRNNKAIQYFETNIPQLT
jgi:hypothetical protein